jgi:uncharacterized peroxidase-related enzyme
MQNLKNVDPSAATGKTKDVFDALQKNLGVVPNLMRTLANSPAALNAYMGFNAALGESKIPASLREQLAMTVATLNNCDYCLSAHNALGKLAGLSSNDLSLAQNAQASDPKAGVALRFAAAIVTKRGLLGASEVKTMHDAGYTDGDIAEIIAVVAINIFTNYFSHIAGTDIDFPVVKSTPAR